MTAHSLLFPTQVVCSAKRTNSSTITNPSCFLTRKCRNVYCRDWTVSFGNLSKLFPLFNGPADRVKGQTAIFEEMIEDEEGLVDDRLPTTSRGLWAASETERTLKAILAFAKSKRLDPELVEEGNTFMELFENWKKEYKVSVEVHDLHGH